MTDEHDTQIAQQLGRLSSVEPDAEGTSALISRIRGRLRSEPAACRWHWPTRAAIPAGIAAGLLVACGLVLLLWPNEPASAAEQLEQIGRAAANYRGWIHITVDLERSDFKMPEELHGLTLCSEHTNTVDGTQIRDMKIGDHRRIEFRQPAQNRIQRYDSHTGQITIVPIGEVTAAGLMESKAMSPVTVGQLLAKFAESIDLKPLSITSHPEGQLVRYEIELPPDRAVVALAERKEAKARRMHVWVDPQTKRMQRIMHQFDFEDSQHVVFIDASYGEPAIDDMYDLGVPRDAPIVDRRPAEDVNDLIDKLQAQFEQGFGNYVAAVTSVHFDRDGKRLEGLGSVTLHARQDTRWLTMHYLVGSKSYEDGRPRQAVIDFPEGWPQPSLAELLKRLSNVAPSESWSVTDGDRFWNDRTGELEANQKHNAMYSQPAGIWRASRLSARGPDTTTVIRARTDKPGLVGVQMAGRFHDGQQWQETWWFDPTHDYLMAEEIHLTEQKGFKTVRRYEYQHTQLLNGRWFPQSWKSKTTTYQPDGKVARAGSSQYYLQLDPDMKLDDSWFTDPRSRGRPRDAGAE